MTRRTHVAQYYAEDKDIFDILMSSRRRFDTETLVALALRRGICLSVETDREKLADYLARLVWSWPELQHLLDLAETPERKEKLTSTRFASGAAVEDIRAAVSTVKEVREAKQDETLTVKMATETKLTVAVRYTEFDPSRTRLQQRVEREVSLEIERSDSGYNVRHQASDRAREVARDIVAKLQEMRGVKFDASEITLRGIGAPELRTQFFVTLMSKMPGFDLRNVTSVSVDRAAAESEGVDADEDDVEGDSATAEAATMLGEVRKAIFQGESLLTSREFQSLKAEGFFLSRAVWRSREEKPDGIEVEFEADFEDAKHCTGFRYNVRGVYERRTRGEEGIKKTRSPVPAEKRADLLRSLEEAAQSALDKVALEATGSGTAGAIPPEDQDVTGVE
jgi:hypothetical protein